MKQLECSKVEKVIRKHFKKFLDEHFPNKNYSENAIVIDLEGTGKENDCYYLCVDFNEDVIEEDDMDEINDMYDREEIYSVWLAIYKELGVRNHKPLTLSFLKACYENDEYKNACLEE